MPESPGFDLDGLTGRQYYPVTDNGEFFLRDVGDEGKAQIPQISL